MTFVQMAATMAKDRQTPVKIPPIIVTAIAQPVL